MKKSIAVVGAFAAVGMAYMLANWHAASHTETAAERPSFWSMRATPAGARQVTWNVPKGELLPVVPGVVCREFVRAPSLDHAADLELEDELRIVLADLIDYTLEVVRCPKTLSKRRALLLRGKNGASVQGILLQGVSGPVLQLHDVKKNLDYRVASGDGGYYVSVVDAAFKTGTCGVSHWGAPVRWPSPIVPDFPVDGHTYIDMMLAFDTEAVRFAEEVEHVAPADMAELLVQKMNLVLDNSGLLDKFSYRLVDVMELGGYVGNDSHVLLHAINTHGTAEEVSMEPLHVRRDEVGADIVVTLFTTGSHSDGIAGLSNGLITPNVPSFADRAFAVCKVDSAWNGYVISHEVGHIMGAGHADLQKQSPGPQLFKHSAGYYGDDFATVMAYIDEVHDHRVPSFSTPDRTFEGMAVGDAEHDNAKTLAQTYPFVANFRESKVVEEVEPSKPDPMAHPVYLLDAEAAPTRTDVSAHADHASETVCNSTRKATADGAKARQTKKSRRRVGRSSITSRDVKQRGQEILEEENPRGAGELRPDVVINLEREAIVEAVKEKLPDVTGVLEECLPDGKVVVQMPGGEIILPPNGEGEEYRSDFGCTTDMENGVFEGGFKLLYTDADGEHEANVDIFGLIMEGEAVGITTIPECGSWLMTIAPEEESVKPEQPEEIPTEDVVEE